MLVLRPTHITSIRLLHPALHIRTMSSANWHDVLPQPVSKPDRISVEELHALVGDESKVAGKDFVVVDVRRSDIEVRA
jgi:hypothetical protein